MVLSVVLTRARIFQLSFVVESFLNRSIIGENRGVALLTFETCWVRADVVQTGAKIGRVQRGLAFRHPRLDQEREHIVLHNLFLRLQQSEDVVRGSPLQRYLAKGFVLRSVVGRGAGVAWIAAQHRFFALG